MREILDKFRVNQYHFTVEFDSGSDPGGEISVWIQSGGKPLLSRTFYFGGDQEHIRAFAKKFANDPEYRQSCIEGTVKWARVNKWFYRNNYIYSMSFITQWAAANKQELKIMKAQQRSAEDELKKLYEIISKRIDQFESTVEYKEHLLIEGQSPEPTMGRIDPGIEKVVAALNQIPGVATKFSCEGIRRGVKSDEWEYGLIWFPGKHDPLAYIQFERIPSEIAQKLDVYLRQGNVGFFQSNRIQSNCPDNNALFVSMLEELLSNHEL